MATNFPASLDSFTTKVDNETAVLAAHVNDLQSAVTALEAKVGVNSSAVTTSHDKILSSSVVKIATTQIITGTKTFYSTLNAQAGIEGPIGGTTPDTGCFTGVWTDALGFLNSEFDIDEFSIDGTLAGNSDTAVPTEKAVKTYVDARVLTVGERENIIANCDGNGHQVLVDTFVSVTARYDAGSTNIVIHSDSSATPTTVVGKDRGSMAFVSVLIKKNHYYKIVITDAVNESIAYAQILSIA
jgi:hypothetical protein